MSCPTILPKANHTATVIFLHGLGDTGHGWLAGLESIALPYVKYMCPNAPAQAVTMNGGFVMPAWFDIYSLDKTAPCDTVGIAKSSNELAALIEKEVQSGIPSDRILLGGFSQGGAVAMDTFTTYGNKLAGCVGLSTYLARFATFPKMCHIANKETPVFLAHGDSDALVAYGFGQKSQAVMKSFFSNVDFKTYNGMGHTSSPQEMKDVAAFIKTVLPTLP